MERLINTIISLSAVGLLSLGGYLAFFDKTASATAVLGFGFLLVVLLLLAKFKRFKGFGFEAEMWEDKQNEAAALVDRLTLLSNAVTEQIALIASKLGLWGGALTNPELADLIDQLLRLQSDGISDKRKKELLKPIYNRLELNYWHAARRFVDTALRDEMIKNTALYADSERTARVIRHAEDEKHFGEINTYQQFVETQSLKPLITFAKTCHTLEAATELHHELDELDLDLQHLRTNGSLRRKIDLLAASPPRFAPGSG